MKTRIKGLHRIIIGIVIVGSVFSNIAFSQVDTAFHIFLMFGQSNMEGQGTIDPRDRVTNPRVFMLQDSTCPNLNRTYGTWYTASPPLNRCWGKLGPGDSFGKMMGAATPSHVKIGLVNVSVSGCNIFIYKKGCPNGLDEYSQGIPFGCGYTWLLDLAKKAQQAGVIKGILFHQGETNNTDPEWKYTVQKIVADLKTDLGLDDIPFLAGELLYSEYGSCCGAHNTEIRKLPGLIPNAHVISAEGLPGSDYAHFTSESYRTFGERYARKMLYLLYGICDSTTIESWYSIDGEPAVKGDNILIGSKNSLVLSPRPENALGTWSWSGAGTSGSSRQQTIVINSEHTDTAIVVYTNECGTKSRLPVRITVCDTTPIQPWFKINNEEWIQRASVNILHGSGLTLKTTASDTGGNWNWSGAGITGNDSLANFNTEMVGTYLVHCNYTNLCGARSELDFTIYVCDSSAVESWYILNDAEAVKSDSIIVDQNSTLILSPHPKYFKGTWNWSGAVTGSGREQSVNTEIPGSFVASLTYLNSCSIPSRMTVNITVKPASVSSEQFRLGEVVGVNPNPAINGTFTLNGVDNIRKVELIDLAGFSIFSVMTNGESSLHINTFINPGIYLIRMYDGDQYFYKKLVIN